MKKLFLAVAAFATMAFGANAQITGFTSATGSYTNLASGINVSGTDPIEFKLQPGAITTVMENFKIADISFLAQGPGGTAAERTTWRIYPGLGFVFCNTGSGTPQVTIPATNGEKITVVFGNGNGPTGSPVSFSITGADVTTSGDIPPGASTNSDTDKTPVVLTATGTITIAMPNKGKIYSITSGTSAIGDVTADGKVKAAAYDLMGNQVDDETVKGFYIQTYTDGSKEKIFRK
ncbi:MAG: hypothetical protein LBR81_01700 [Prevotellaceae bacterium]|jgi:hypothetical protein|nr:hypothetical protein [Prevotellaceae bacterium]